MPKAKLSTLETIYYYRRETLHGAVFYFVFCVFMHYAEISAVGLEELMDVRICAETLS